MVHHIKVMYENNSCEHEFGANTFQDIKPNPDY